MPSQTDADPENEWISAIWPEYTEHVRDIDSAAMDEDPSKTRNELAKLRTYLNGVFADQII